MDKYDISNNAGEPNKENSSEILKREPIEGTPFTVTGNDEQGFAISFGKYRLGEIRETPQEAEADLIDEMWNIAARMAGVICDITLEQHKRDEAAKNG